ncbi:hypothetical protein GCM10007094_44180 [Pseudovibrio japonicus]|uniref:Uncharacterized protein n=1 Tax=Pseudovibrio japonicus TaxID=366534 RepID=A0ABQ3ERZ8_9HYPH|nr:hypothetical protein GCM10007094_44180 [Pseudovibrio japonicus]
MIKLYKPGAIPRQKILTYPPIRPNWTERAYLGVQSQLFSSLNLSSANQAQWAAEDYCASVGAGVSDADGG